MRHEHEVQKTPNATYCIQGLAQIQLSAHRICEAMEQPASCGEQRAKVDAPDWNAVWKEAKERYDEADRQLGAEVRKKDGNHQYIDLLRERMRNAQTDKENAHQMLLKSQPEPSQAHQLPNRLSLFLLGFPSPLIPTT